MPAAESRRRHSALVYRLLFRGWFADEQAIALVVLLGDFWALHRQVFEIRARSLSSLAASKLCGV